MVFVSLDGTIARIPLLPGAGTAPGAAVIPTLPLDVRKS